MSEYTATTITNTAKRRIETEITGPDASVLVSVSTHHNKDRGTYLTTITAFRAEGYFRKTVITFGNHTPAPIPNVSTPVGRHSGKALAAAHESAYGEMAGDALHRDLYNWGVQFLAEKNI